MKLTFPLSLVLLFSGFLVLGPAGTGASEEADLKNVPIQDYDPVSMLKSGETVVEKAKFPAVDVHNHLRRADTPEKVDEMIRAMDDTNVAAVVNLDGGWGETLDKNIERLNKRYPGRFIQYMRIDWSRIDEPGFGETMAQELERGFKIGAQGLKISKTLGLRAKDKTGKLVRIDDPRLDPIWAKCGELGIPVSIHSADPVAFWTPLDTKNERLIELMDHPQWVYGPDSPSREELLRQRNAMIARHPNTNFVCVHVAGAPEDLERVGEWLDKYPNFYVDTSARIPEMGRQPYTARRFFMKYQDRILFGTDTTPISGHKLAKDGQEMFRIHWRWFETDDEYFDPRKTHHLQSLWRVCGIYLPDEVLKKIYYENAVRLIPGLKVSAP
jgi:predicted TIM-barrel fold metal-dependent hydrolase